MPIGQCPCMRRCIYLSIYFLSSIIYYLSAISRGSEIPRFRVRIGGGVYNLNTDDEYYLRLVFNRWSILTPHVHPIQAMETVFRFPFPRHLVEECVDLSQELRRRIFKCLVEESAIRWMGGNQGVRIRGNGELDSRNAQV